jgi:hypothetical protein
MLRLRDQRGGFPVTFKAYLENIEKQTGVKPTEWAALAEKKGFGPGTKATPVTAWLKADYKLGHGHAMAIVKLLKDKGVPGS